MNAAPPFDARSVRALLAAERITRLEYARACHLHRTNVSSYLSENLRPGARTRQKLYEGLVQLGLDCEALHA